MSTGRRNWNKVVLGLAFAIGSAGIWYLKAEEYTNLVIIGFPIVILSVYWGFALIVCDEHTYEIIGDNCYYLGFVFTLTSLAVTLYLLDTSQDEVLLGGVISGFGVALSSTIAGIVLRVLMQRMTPDMAEQESEVRVDLEQAIRDFRTHLSMGINEMSSFSVETSQILTELRGTIQKALEYDADAHKQATQASMTALKKFYGDTEKEVTVHRTTLQRSLEHNMHAYQEAIEEGVSAFREELRRVTTSFTDLDTHIRDVLQRNVDHQMQGLKNGAASLHEIMENSMRTYQEAIEEGVDTFRETLKGITTVLTDAETHARNVQRSADNQLQVLSSETRELTKALSGLIDKLATVDDGIVTKLEPAVMRMSEGATSISAELEASSGKLKSAAERFKAAAERTVAADMQANISNAAEKLATATDRLGELADRMANPRPKKFLGIFPTRGR